MSEFSQEIDEASDISVGALQSAVWLVQNLGIAMPPVPDIYADSLDEVVYGKVFATNPALAEIDDPYALGDALAKGWPSAGLAFGFQPRSFGGYWFYTLVSEKLVLHLSLRVTGAGGEESADLISAAHRQLEEYLSIESNYFRATSSHGPDGEAKRQVISYSDHDGILAENHATWSEQSGLSAFDERSEIFTDATGEPIGVERVIWG